MLCGHDVAIYIIDWCSNHHVEITNLKLQKLLYFVQGEYSRYTGSRLIAEDFYAWQLGPVMPEIYAKYSIYSSSILPAQSLTTILSQEDISVVDSILQKYAQKSTWSLVDLSHQQDPWKYNYEIFGDKAVIPYKSIADYFKSGETV